MSPKLVNTKQVALAATATALLIGGCGTIAGSSSSSSSSSATVSLGVQATAPKSSASVALNSDLPGAAATLASPQISVTDKNGNKVGTITVTSAKMALKEIKVKFAESDASADSSKKSQNDSVKLTGPYIFDLLTGQSTPSLDSVSMAAGTYKQIEVKLTKSDTLGGRSISISGTYSGSTASGTVTGASFSLDYDMDETFEMTPAGKTAKGMDLSGGTTNSVIIAFRLNKWFIFNNTETNSNGVDFSQASVTNGVILLDKTTEVSGNKEIRKVIKDNIKASADYGKDGDGDGSLSSSEDDDDDSEDSKDS